jgi:uncharacterized protein YutE (UPF0331/DUF86 family)
MVDPDRVCTKLGHLEKYLKGLDEKQDCSLNEYRHDRDIQDIVERRFEKAVQACLDIASHIIATEDFREPQNYGDMFRILEENEILSPTLADEMVEMAGFRNVLAHEYATIDDDRVYHHLEDLDQFYEYVKVINGFID